MPRTIPNYSQSIIYKLCCNDPEITDIYVGSTTNFSNRKKAHKSICNNETSGSYNQNVYQFIRNNGNWDNWSMIQIEQYNATDKRNLETRERHYIEQLGTTLNKIIPTRTKEQWHQDNPNYNKRYFKQNKEKWKQYNKQTNRVEKNEKQNLNYQNNKQQLKEQRDANRIECECGSIYQRASNFRHLRTKKHREYQNIYDFIYS